MESTIQSTQTFSSVSDSERTPLEEYKFVRQLEAEERSRRIEDVNGEFTRKQNAHKVSEMFGLNTRPTWFQEGSSYFFEIIKHARQSGNNILQFSQAKANQMTSDLSNFAGRKGYEASEILRANIDAVSNKGIENAYAVKDAALQKASEVTLTISDKAGSTGYEANTKIREKLDDAVLSIGAVTNEGAHKAAVKAGELSQTALGVAKEQLGNASTIAHNTALKVRSVSASFLGKFNETLNNISYNTHMAYLSLQENTEKAYRLNSDNEVYAILNGLMVSNLIKDLGYEFYRPTSEPSRLYSTRLLEKYESTSRMGRDVTGPAISNAKAISKLIEQKFHSATSITAVDSTVVPTPALIAAKADVVSEIKHNVPTAPTLTPMGANM